MNKAILIGNLTRDPENKVTPMGTAVTTFTLAVTRRFPDAQGNRATDYIPVVAWRKTAELCGQYLAKGRKVGIVGQIQTRSYDAQDGSKRYVTEVVADEVEFLGSKNDGQQNTAQTAQQDTSMPGFTEVDDPEDELPF